MRLCLHEREPVRNDDWQRVWTEQPVLHTSRLQTAAGRLSKSYVPGVSAAGQKPSDGKVPLQVRFQATRVQLQSEEAALSRIPEFDMIICPGVTDPDDSCPVSITLGKPDGIVRIEDFRAVR